MCSLEIVVVLAEPVQSYVDYSHQWIGKMRVGNPWHCNQQLSDELLLDATVAGSKLTPKEYAAWADTRLARLWVAALLML